MKKTIILLILAILTPLFVFAAIPDLYMSQVGFNGNIENTSGSIKIIAKTGSSYTLVNGNISDVDVSGTGSVIFSQCNITGFIKLSGTTQVSFINCNITGSDADNKYLIDIRGMTSGSSFSMINTVFSDPSNVTIDGYGTYANVTITGSADRLCGNQSYPIKKINLYDAKSTSLRMNQYVYVRTLDLSKTNNTLAGQMATDPNYSWNNWNVLGNVSEGGIILNESKATAININNSRIKSISLKDSTTIESISIIGSTNLLNVDASNSPGNGKISSATITMNSGSSATLNLANNRLGSSSSSGRWVEDSFPIETRSLPVSESQPAAVAGAYYTTYSNVQGPFVEGFICEHCNGAGKFETGSHQEERIYYKAEIEACTDEDGNVLWVEKNAQGQAVGTVAVLKEYADQNNISVTPLVSAYALEKNIDYDHTILYAEPYVVMETVIDYTPCEVCEGAGTSGAQTWTATCTIHSYAIGGTLTINGTSIYTYFCSTGRTSGSFDFVSQWNGINTNVFLNGNGICYRLGICGAAAWHTHSLSASCRYMNVPDGAVVFEADPSNAPAQDANKWGNGGYTYSSYASVNGIRIGFPKEGYYGGEQITSDRVGSNVNGSIYLYQNTDGASGSLGIKCCNDNDEVSRSSTITIWPYGK